MPSAPAKLLCCFTSCVVLLCFSFLVILWSLPLGGGGSGREGNVDKLEEGWNICESTSTGPALINSLCFTAGTGSMWLEGGMDATSPWFSEHHWLMLRERLLGCWWITCIFLIPSRKKKKRGLHFHGCKQPLWCNNLIFPEKPMSGQCLCSCSSSLSKLCARGFSFSLGKGEFFPCFPFPFLPHLV